MAKHHLAWARLERARDVFDRNLDAPDPDFGRAPLAEIATAGHGCPLGRVQRSAGMVAPATQKRPPEANLSPIRRGYEADPFSLDASQAWGASHARAHSRFTDRKASDAHEADMAARAILAHAERRAPDPVGQRTREERDRAVASTLAAYAASLHRIVQNDPLFGMSDDQVLAEMLASQRRIIGDE